MNDVRRGERFSCSCAEQETTCTVADELLQQCANGWMEVNLTHASWCLEPILYLAPANLLHNGDGQEVGGDVLVNLDAKRLSDSKTSCTAEDEKHPLTFLFPRSQARHHLRGKTRSILLFLFDDRHVDELVVPLARIRLLTFFINSRGHNHFHNLSIVAD